MTAHQGIQSYHDSRSLDFLVPEREGQRDYMAGDDKVLIEKMENKFIKAKVKEQQCERSKNDMEFLTSAVVLESSSSAKDISNEDSDSDCGSLPKKMKTQ